MRDMILKGDPALLCLIALFPETGDAPGDEKAHFGGGSEGVPLYMVDGQNILVKLVFSLCIFVGGITSVVDPHQ